MRGGGGGDGRLVADTRGNSRRFIVEAMQLIIGRVFIQLLHSLGMTLNCFRRRLRTLRLRQKYLHDGYLGGKILFSRIVNRSKRARALSRILCFSLLQSAVVDSIREAVAAPFPFRFLLDSYFNSSSWASSGGSSVRPCLLGGAFEWSWLDWPFVLLGWQ